MSRGGIFSDTVEAYCYTAVLILLLFGFGVGVVVAKAAQWGCAP